MIVNHLPHLVLTVQNKGVLILIPNGFELFCIHYGKATAILLKYCCNLLPVLLTCCHRVCLYLYFVKLVTVH